MPSQQLTRALYGLSTFVLALYVLAAGLTLAWCAPTLLGLEAWQSPKISVPVDVTVHEPSWRVEPLTSDGSPAALVDLSGDLTVRPTSPGMLVLLLWPSLLGMAIGLVVLLTLRNMLRDVRDGTPFTPANVRRIRILAGVVVLRELLSFLSPQVVSAVLSDSLVAPGLTLGFIGRLESAPFVFALVLMVLAEIFAHGLRLEDDQTLTV